MNRVYKLACNFNTVEVSDINYKDLLDVAHDDEIIQDPETGEKYICPDVYEETLIARLLQREYDIVAEIKTANVIGVGAAPTKMAQAPAERPSEKQIEWARNLGMKDPESHSKQEVSAFIAKHNQRNR